MAMVAPACEGSTDVNTAGLPHVPTAADEPGNIGPGVARATSLTVSVRATEVVEPARYWPGRRVPAGARLERGIPSSRRPGPSRVRDG